MPSWSRVITTDNVSTTVVLLIGQRTCLTGVRSLNTTAAAAYTQLFDVAAAASVTPGTTVPRWVVKSGSTDPADGDGLPTHGLIFENGIAVISTTTVTGATPATQHVRITIE